MKLSLKNPLQAKACSFAATTMALATMAASTALADHVRVFNEKVSGVPEANPVAVADNVYGAGIYSRPGRARHGFTREPVGRDYAIRKSQRWQPH